MPKQTKKYKTAVTIASQLDIALTDNQELLYGALNASGFYWASDIQQWQQLAHDADAPTDLIRVRVWAETSRVEGAVYQLRIAMEEQGYKFLDKSEPYPCRPPKQLESRVYLLFR